MSRRFISVIGVTISMFIFGACGPEDRTNESHVSPPHGVVDVFGNTVSVHYRCPDEATSIEVAVGETVRKDGSYYSLVEGRDNAGQQLGVTLNIRLADGHEVPLVTVGDNFDVAHTAFGAPHYEPLVRNGESYATSFSKRDFGRNSGTVDIATVTVCTVDFPYEPPQARDGQ